MSRQQQDTPDKAVFKQIPHAYFWILIVGLVIYFPIFFNGFVWDDNIFILNNPEVHAFSFMTFLGKSIFNSAYAYRPITYVYFAFMYSLFGEHAFFYHLAQV